MGRPDLSRAVLSDPHDLGIRRDRRPRESLVSDRQGAEARQLQEREGASPRGPAADQERRPMKTQQPPHPDDDDDDDDGDAPETPPDEPRPQPVRAPPQETPEKGP